MLQHSSAEVAMTTWREDRKVHVPDIACHQWRSYYKENISRWEEYWELVKHSQFLIFYTDLSNLWRKPGSEV